MNERTLHRTWAYFLVLAAPAVTLLVRWPLSEMLGGRLIYMTFLPAIVVVAYVGGFWPGFLTTLIGALASTYFLAGNHSLAVATVHDAAGLGLLILIGALISGLSESLQRAQRAIVVDERRKADLACCETASRTLRISEERFRGTFENAAVGIIHCDEQGRFLRVNNRYCEIVGYSREELLKMSIRDVTYPEDMAGTHEKFTALLQGRLPSYSEEKRDVRKDGSLIWIDVSTSLQRDERGKPLHAIGVLQDISERKRLEEELRQAKEAAEAANRAKDEFLANVSHEIRTPMNAILGLTELALETPLTDDLRQSLRTVKSAADSLLAIINDLLDFSKIAAGKMKLDAAAFSLRASVEDTVLALAPRAKRKNLDLTCRVQPGVPDALVGDAGRLRQVLLNLVGNALKFTEQGRVSIDAALNDSVAVDGSLDSAVNLRFTVRDTGIGIAPEKQAAIFRAFEQEDNSITRRYGGTGLGLTISARLVALMGGAITVESTPSRGSAFSFTARFERPTQLSERETVVATSNGSPAAADRPMSMRVLVAEDNEFNSMLLDKLLVRRGHHVRIANNGREALSLAECGKFDVLLLDIHMPELDGFQVVRAIRQHETAQGGHLPVIALTARSRQEDRERCLAAGMDDVFTKPIHFENLWASMDRLVVRPLSPPPCPSLLDRRVLLAACGGDPVILQKLCEALQSHLPDHLAAVQRALQVQDAAQLREAAHRLCGMVSTFSSLLGGVASDLEDTAAAGHLDDAKPLVMKLETLSRELLRTVSDLSVEALDY